MNHSLRDQFAIHAPKEPWPWFTPNVPEPPKPRKDIHGDPTWEYKCDCISYDELKKKERILQWPYFYADEMMRQRGEDGPQWIPISTPPTEEDKNVLWVNLNHTSRPSRFGTPSDVMVGATHWWPLPDFLAQA